jgi:hypothetical protein
MIYRGKWIPIHINPKATYVKHCKTMLSAGSSSVSSSGYQNYFFSSHSQIQTQRGRHIKPTWHQDPYLWKKSNVRLALMHQKQDGTLERYVYDG